MAKILKSVYVYNMPPYSLNSYQPRFPGIEVHYLENVPLGGAGDFDWHQNKVVGPYWRAYWNENAGGIVQVGHQEIQLKPDRVVVLSPDTVYSTRLVQPIRHFYVHFSSGRPFSQVAPGIFELTDVNLVSQARQLAELVQTQQDDYRTHMKLQQYLCEVLLQLPTEVIPPLTDYDSRIERVIALLEKVECPANPQLARMVNMSTNGFLHLFKQHVGVSPQRYARRRRLEQAAIQLQYSGKSIEEISDEMGFADRFHFTKCFKNEFGIGPAAYRKFH
ncbi:MAG TPA: hypothetical protein DCM28_09735 [Phycisphaerales bacterium]|nr:hypothetical protein [Phycisphaerales bacterium]|tara:strand:+ start:554 stop:1381 length:828 start_codon:yes stop_codon:yes gene_type:complete